MENFSFCTPTKVVFGKGSIAELPNLIAKKSKVLMTYGGGSIFKNTVYDQVIKALKGYQIVEFGGIEPNPHFDTCLKAAELARRENVDFLLAVGGGSVLDGTKFIAAAAKYTGKNAWDIVRKGLTVSDAIPLGDIMTLPATGSEMNAGAVISNPATGEKMPFFSELVMPKFSIIDPAATCTLPARQTANGIVDTFVHVMEQYATHSVNTPVQDLSALAVIRTLIQEAPKVMADPNDYDARANLCWCATLGLNGWLGLGCVQDWATHMIGHELTAEYGLDHGQTLAIVMPRVWQYEFAAKKAKLALMAREVWHSCECGEDQAAAAAIARTVAFFASLGVKTSLADYGIDAAAAAKKVRQRLAARKVKLGENGDIDSKVAEKILLNC